MCLKQPTERLDAAQKLVLSGILPSALSRQHLESIFSSKKSVKDSLIELTLFVEVFLADCCVNEVAFSSILSAIELLCICECPLTPDHSDLLHSVLDECRMYYHTSQDDGMFIQFLVEQYQRGFLDTKGLFLLNQVVSDIQTSGFADTTAFVLDAFKCIVEFNSKSSIAFIDLLLRLDETYLSPIAIREVVSEYLVAEIRSSSIDSLDALENGLSNFGKERLVLDTSEYYRFRGHRSFCRFEKLCADLWPFSMNVLITFDVFVESKHSFIEKGFTVLGIALDDLSFEITLSNDCISLSQSVLNEEYSANMNVPFMINEWNSFGIELRKGILFRDKCIIWHNGNSFSFKKFKRILPNNISSSFSMKVGNIGDHAISLRMRHFGIFEINSKLSAEDFCSFGGLRFPRSLVSSDLGVFSYPDDSISSILLHEKIYIFVRFEGAPFFQQGSTKAISNGISSAQTSCTFSVEGFGRYRGLHQMKPYSSAFLLSLCSSLGNCNSGLFLGKFLSILKELLELTDLSHLDVTWLCVLSESIRKCYQFLTTDCFILLLKIANLFSVGSIPFVQIVISPLIFIDPKAANNFFSTLCIRDEGILQNVHFIQLLPLLRNEVLCDDAFQKLLAVIIAKLSNAVNFEIALYMCFANLQAPPIQSPDSLSEFLKARYQEVDYENKDLNFFIENPRRRMEFISAMFLHTYKHLEYRQKGSVFDAISNAFVPKAGVFLALSFSALFDAEYSSKLVLYSLKILRCCLDDKSVLTTFKDADGFRKLFLFCKPFAEFTETYIGLLELFLGMLLFDDTNSWSYPLDASAVLESVMRLNVESNTPICHENAIVIALELISYSLSSKDDIALASNVLSSLIYCFQLMPLAVQSLEVTNFPAQLINLLGQFSRQPNNDKRETDLQEFRRASQNHLRQALEIFTEHCLKFSKGGGRLFIRIIVYLVSSKQFFASETDIQFNQVMHTLLDTLASLCCTQTQLSSKIEAANAKYVSKMLYVMSFESYLKSDALLLLMGRLSSLPGKVFRENVDAFKHWHIFASRILLLLIKRQDEEAEEFLLQNISFLEQLSIFQNRFISSIIALIVERYGKEPNHLVKQLLILPETNSALEMVSFLFLKPDGSFSHALLSDVGTSLRDDIFQLVTPSNQDIRDCHLEFEYIEQWLDESKYYMDLDFESNLHGRLERLRDVVRYCFYHARLETLKTQHRIPLELKAFEEEIDKIGCLKSMPYPLKSTLKVPVASRWRLGSTVSTSPGMIRIQLDQRQFASDKSATEAPMKKFSITSLVNPQVKGPRSPSKLSCELPFYFWDRRESWNFDRIHSCRQRQLYIPYSIASSLHNISWDQWVHLLVPYDHEVLDFFVCLLVRMTDFSNAVLVSCIDSFYLIQNDSAIDSFPEMPASNVVFPDKHLMLPFAPEHCRVHVIAHRSIELVERTSFLGHDSGLIIKTKDGFVFNVVMDTKSRDRVIDLFPTAHLKGTESSGGKQNALSRFSNSNKNDFTKAWMEGRISSFDYLLILNEKGGRTFDNLSQYPIFPWILQDYDSNDWNDPSVYRNLGQPIGLLKRSSERVKQQFDDALQIQGSGYHYSTHYSAPATVLHYLVRLEPYTQLHWKLDAAMDHPNRIFHSVSDSWHIAGLQDSREIIPEFFCLPQFLMNKNALRLGERSDNQIIDHVQLPQWAKGSANFFIRMHRALLEGEYVSAFIHHWIDLIFGFKQKGKSAIAALNVFKPNTYPGDINMEQLTYAQFMEITSFGQAPTQLFLSSHAPRKRLQHIGSISLFPEFLEPIEMMKSMQSVKSIYVSAKAGNISSLSDCIPIPLSSFMDHSVSICFGLPNGSLVLNSGNNQSMFSNVHGNAIAVVGRTSADQTFCSGSFDGSICFWEIEKHSSNVSIKLTRHKCVFAHSGEVTAIATCHRFKIAVSISTDCSFVAWNTRRYEIMFSIVSFPRLITSISICNLRGDIVACSRDIIYVYDLNGEELARLESKIPAICSVVIFACSRTPKSTILTGHNDGSIAVWSLEFHDTWNIILCSLLSNHFTSSPVSCIKVSESRDSCATGHVDGCLVRWSGPAGGNLGEASHRKLFQSSIDVEAWMIMSCSRCRSRFEGSDHRCQCLFCSNFFCLNCNLQHVRDSHFIES